MIREHIQTSGSSHPVGTIIAGIVCAVGLSCCFITKDDLNSWRQNDSGGRYRYDSGGYSGGGGGGGSSVGDGVGYYDVFILEAQCYIGWRIYGYYDTDYSWDALLTVDSGLTDCIGASDTSGTIAAFGGSVYWNNTSYIGEASYSGTTLAWATNGYVTGSGGGSYAYAGYITW